VNRIPRTADWTRAACRGEDPELFFPAGETGTAARDLYRIAAQVCIGCPVARACLDRALAAEGLAPAQTRYGLFGGLTPAERAKLARRHLAAA
jgi:WhiB family redox-sensing transcriptional regulator